MLDVEPLIRDELQRLSTLDKSETGDWQAILDQAAPRRQGRRTAWVAVAFVVALAVVIPALAFSGTVRSLVGLHQPSPRYDQARLRVEVRHASPSGRDYVYRLWTAPSTQGGSCFFLTEGTASTPSLPKGITGGGFCSVGRHALTVPNGRFTWSIGSAAPGAAHVLSGVAGAGMRVSQMTLRWHGGSQRIATHEGYFLGLIPIALNPPFKLLPFDLVATDSHRRIVATERIPTSFLYIDWKKKVEAKLTAYRHAHGCNKTPPIWHCRSR